MTVEAAQPGEKAPEVGGSVFVFFLPAFSLPAPVTDLTSSGKMAAHYAHPSATVIGPGVVM